MCQLFCLLLYTKLLELLLDLAFCGLAEVMKTCLVKQGMVRCHVRVCCSAHALCVAVCDRVG